MKNFKKIFKKFNLKIKHIPVGKYANMETVIINGKDKDVVIEKINDLYLVTRYQKSKPIVEEDDCLLTEEEALVKIFNFLNLKQSS